MPHQILHQPVRLVTSVITMQENIMERFQIIKTVEVLVVIESAIVVGKPQISKFFVY